MIYSFYCNKCDKEIYLDFKMNDSGGRNNAKCPECNSKLERVWSAPEISVKRDTIVGTKGGASFVNNGDVVKFGFADHGKMSGVGKRSIGKRMSGVRVDEKSGRMVVDVVSNVKDPLGKLEKMKSETIKRSINQKIRTRK